MGCANQAGEDNRDVARMAVLLAGLPLSIGGTTVNRLCGSGMDAVLMAARTIATGGADILLAGGVESMSRAPFVMPKATSAFSRDNAVFDTTIGWRFVNPLMHKAFGTDSMPETAETSPPTSPFPAPTRIASRSAASFAPSPPRKPGVSMTKSSRCRCRRKRASR